MPETDSPSDVNFLRRAIDLKGHVQAEMRWKMGEMLAKLLTRQLPKGFLCRYEKYDEIGWNKGEAFSDRLVIYDNQTGDWVVIQMAYLLGKPFPYQLKIEERNEFSFIAGRPHHRRLLEVLRQWIEEFELTSNIDEIIKTLEHYGTEVPKESEREERLIRRERARKVRALTKGKVKPKY